MMMSLILRSGNALDNYLISHAYHANKCDSPDMFKAVQVKLP